MMFVTDPEIEVWFDAEYNKFRYARKRSVLAYLFRMDKLMTYIGEL